MLFDTTEIEPASSAWRQPLQMRARSEVVPGLEWEISHFGMNVDCVAFNGESNHLVGYGAGRNQCTVLEITPTSNTPKISTVTSFTPPSPIYDMHWGAKNYLLAASNEGRVYRYNYNPAGSPPKNPYFIYTLGKLKATGKPGFSTRVRRVASYPETGDVFAGLENGNVHIWETETGELNISKKVSENALTALSWSPYFHHRAMVGGFSRALRLFDVSSGEVVWRKEEAHATGLITDIAFHPFVPWWLASAGEDGCVRIWDLRCGARALASLDDHFAAVSSIAWSPTHSELIASASVDRRFKIWSLNLPPHYVCASRACEAPFVGSGFPRRGLFHACGVTHSGEVVVAKLEEAFIEPLVPRLDSGDGEIEETREVAKLIYFREFSVAFEKALALAERLSFQHKPEMALAVLDLAYQRSTPSIDPNVHPDTPLAEALQNFQNELKTYSYYVPPGYHAQFGTQIKDEIMDKIQTLRLRLELQRAASLNLCSDILDRAKDVVEMLEKDSKMFPPSLLTNLIQIIMPHDFVKALEMAIDIADVLAMSGDFNIFLPIARMLLFPTIYESDLIYENEEDDTKLEEKITKTQSSEIQLVEKLLRKNDILEQLTFMKKFYAKLWSEQDDLLKFTQDNQPDIIMSASLNRLYLNILISNNKYLAFFNYALALKKECGKSKFGDIIQQNIDASYARLSAFLKDVNTKDEDREKGKEIPPAEALVRIEDTILMVLGVLYSTSIFPFPDELSDMLDPALKPLTTQLERHYIQLLKVRETDPAKPSPKAAVSARAKAFSEKVKEITEGKKNNSDGVLSEKDLKRLHNSLSGFF